MSLCPVLQTATQYSFKEIRALGDGAWREEVSWQVVRVQPRCAPRDVPQGVLLGGLRSKSG